MRSGTLGALAAAALLVAACGAPPPGDAAAEDTPTSITDAPTMTAASPAVTRNTFRYELLATFRDVEGEWTLRLAGAVDLDAHLAEMRIDAADFAALDGVDPALGVEEIVIVQGAETRFVRGLPAEFEPDAIEEIDPAAWYEYDFFGGAGPDAFFLADTPHAADLWALVDALPDGAPDPEGRAGFVTRSAAVTRDQLEDVSGGNTFFDFAGGTQGEVTLTTVEDEAGRLVSAQLAAGSDGVEIRTTVEIVARGEDVAIAVPTDVQPLVLAAPTTTTTTLDAVDVALAEAREQAMEDLRSRILHPDRNPMEGVVIRVSIPGGWELPDEITQHLSVEADGRVVRVMDASVVSSTADYTSLRLSPEGVDALLQMIADSGVLSAPRNLLDGGAGVSPTDRSVHIEVPGVGDASVDRLGATDGYDLDQQQWRERFDDVLQQLLDMSWLEEQILEPEGPWIPDSMTVMAGDISPRSGLPDDAPFAPWPLPQTIEERATGTALNAYDEEELLICLSGDEVAPVFALLTGVNHAYLRVDDGQQWELNVTPHYPGYRLLTDPCP